MAGPVVATAINNTYFTNCKYVMLGPMAATAFTIFILQVAPHKCEYHCLELISATSQGTHPFTSRMFHVVQRQLRVQSQWQDIR